MPQLTETQEAAQRRLERGRQFERFGFIRRSHLADKFGNSANHWKGEILLTTEVPDVDEIEAARNFETMVITGLLPMHGQFWRLAYINFNFSPTGAERDSLGAAVQCVVRVGYTSDVIHLREPEMIERLELMGITPEYK